MKSVILCRVSSKDQEETGYSLPAQEKLLKEYASKRDFEITKTYSISESASGSKVRLTFNEMMAYIKKEKIKILICEKVDRLTRRFKEAVVIDEWLEEDEERQVHLVKDSLVLHKNSRSQEKLNWGIRVIFAKNYADNLSEEVRKGREEKLAQGWYPGEARFGYVTILQGKHKIPIIDENKAPWIVRMFDLIDTGEYTLRRLSAQLYEEGLRTAAGKQVSITNLQRYLSDPFYIGKIRWEGKIYPGSHEPLINPEQFDRVQRRFKSSSAPKFTPHNYLLKSLVFCGECSGMLTWELKKGTVYGRCHHYRPCNQTICAKELEIEEELVRGLKVLEVKNASLAGWIAKALKESHAGEIERREHSLNELQATLTLLERRLDVLYDDRLDGRITPETYDRKFQQYSAEKEGIVKLLQGSSEGNTRYLELGNNIFELSQRAGELYRTADCDRKRQLLRLVYGKVHFQNNICSYSYTPLFELLANAIAETNSSKQAKSAVFSNITSELSDTRSDKQKTALSGDLCFVWRDRRDSNSRPPP